MIGAGVHALAPLGSTGCLPYLDDAEREAVVETVVGAAADRLPVLAGVSSLGTASTVRHARHAERAGAAAVQVLPSTYWKRPRPRSMTITARSATRSRSR